MKIKVVITILLFVCTCFAQGAADQIGFKFGGGGGYTPFWLATDMQNLNGSIGDPDLPKLDDGLFVSSGGGFVYLMLMKNLRIGAVGYIGSSSNSNRVNSIENEIKYELSGYGLTLEYTLPYIRHHALSFGFTIGRNESVVSIYKNSGSINWNNVFNYDSKSLKLKYNNWVLTPTVNFEYLLSRFLILRAGAGYQINFDGNWEFDNNKVINNAPGDLIKNSYYFQLGILAGFFAF